jgi:hypothetical protein
VRTARFPHKNHNLGINIKEEKKKWAEKQYTIGRNLKILISPTFSVTVLKN